ncbi:MAG TPA: hypothetical protein DDZ88_22880 [Verrucomicrobiales bacterium]|nr:hypothetical protein [Verrucomicrobiales bacterium]
MKWFHWLFCLAALVAGLIFGKWISGAAVAEAEVKQFWGQKDEEECLKALGRLAAINQVRAFDLLLTLEDDDTHGLLQGLMKALPDAGSALMTAFLKHPEQHLSWGVGRTAFRCCAEADPERAWQEMMAHAAKFMPRYLPAIAQGMTQNNPLAAMAYAEKIQSPVSRDQFVHEVLESWSGRDGDGLLKWLREQPNQPMLAKHVNWLRLNITNSAGLADIAAMLPETLADNGRGLSLQAGQAVEGIWIRRIDWLLALPPGETRERLCSVAAQGLAYVDPESALKLLPELRESNVRQLVTGAVAGFRAAVSPQDGLAFANALTDAEERRKARNAVFFTWADNDPAGAAHHALESGDPDARIMLSTAGFSWARSDPESACRFALDHDQQKDVKQGRRNALLTSAVGTWTGTEPVAATRWVKALPEGEARDAAFSAVASALSYRLPEESLHWAQGIKDAEMRRQSLSLCLMSWLHKDQEKPLKWLQQASLDEETRKHLNNYLKPNVQAHQSGQSRGAETYLSEGIMIFR